MEALEERSALEEEQSPQLDQRPSSQTSIRRFKSCCQRAGLAEWTLWNPVEQDRDTAPRYGVYLLTSEGLIAWHDLGDAREIDQAIQDLRKTIQREGSLAFEDWSAQSRKQARALYRASSRRWRKLQGLSQLLMSLDGQLFQLPFEILLDAEGEQLGDRRLSPP